MFLGRVKHERFLWEGLHAHIWPRCFESLLLNVSCYHGNSILTWLEIKELTWSLLFHNRMCLYLQPYQTSTSDFSFSHIFFQHIYIDISFVYKQVLCHYYWIKLRHHSKCEALILVAISSVFLPGRGCEGGRRTEHRASRRWSLGIQCGCKQTVCTVTLMSGESLR